MKALITGASRGIGKSIAEKLAQNNYDLVLLARNQHELEDAKRDLVIFGNDVFIYQVDCLKKEQIDSFFRESAKEFGAIDVLVNNLGIFLPSNLLEEADDDFILQQNANVNAAYYFSKFFGSQMAEANHGHIFNICSIASKSPSKNAGSYSVTKAAMLSLNNVLRQELAESKVKVTAFLPGATLTSSWQDTKIAKEKFVQPEDIADLLYAVLNLSAGANVDEIQITPLYFT